MKTRGLLLAALQLALTLTIAGKFYYDRQVMPRVWARAEPFDPTLPIRGRYVRIAVQAEPGPGLVDGETIGVRLRAENGKLVALPDREGSLSGRVQYGTVRLLEPLAYFIPENVPDPSRRMPGEELWAEVTVPATGRLRPIRLGVKKEGVLTPLALN